MNKQELRDFRGQAREIAQIKATLERMRDDVGPKITSYDAPAVLSGGSGSPVERAVERYLALEARYTSMLDTYTHERNRIEDSIEHLTPNERAVLRAYYLDGLTWEATAYLLGFSYRQVHRLHAAALRSLDTQF